MLQELLQLHHGDGLCQSQKLHGSTFLYKLAFDPQSFLSNLLPTIVTYLPIPCFASPFFKIPFYFQSSYTLYICIVFNQKQTLHIFQGYFSFFQNLFKIWWQIVGWFIFLHDEVSFWAFLVTFWGFFNLLDFISFTLADNLSDLYCLDSCLLESFFLFLIILKNFSCLQEIFCFINHTGIEKLNRIFEFLSFKVSRILKLLDFIPLAC